jgi:glutamate racemase
MSDKQRPIGIFDSGIGGLTVVKQLVASLPNENIIYFGDTARVPYGSKSNDTVIEYSIQDAQFLLSKDVKAIIVACNTASSVAIPALRERFDVPISGVIEPGAKLSVETTNNKKIGVIGTRATILNKAYSSEIKKICETADVFEKPCPLFVPLAEEGWIEHTATGLIAEEYLAELRDKHVDTLILGCTHYPILKTIIQKTMGESVSLIDSGIASASIITQELQQLNLLNDCSTLGKQDFYVSDVPNKFKEVAELFLGNVIENVRKVDLEELRKYHAQPFLPGSK